MEKKLEAGYYRVWPSKHMRQWERGLALSASYDCKANHVFLTNAGEPNIWKIEPHGDGDNTYSLRLVMRDCQKPYLSCDASSCTESADMWSTPQPWHIYNYDGKPHTYKIQRYGKSCKPNLVFDHATGDDKHKVYMNDRTDMAWTIMKYDLNNIQNENWAESSCAEFREWCDDNVLEPQCKTTPTNMSHPECKKWCNRKPYVCDASKKDICTLSLDNMSHDMCVNEYCTKNPNQCADILENLCNAGNLEDYKKMCGCFLPKSDMKNYIDDVYGDFSKGQVTMMTKEPPKCWYAPCTTSYKWAQNLTSDCVPSKFVQCIANADLELQESQVKKLNTNQIMACGNEGNSENIEKLIKEQENRRKQFENRGNSDGNRKLKYLVMICVCCIMISMSIASFIIMSKNK